MMHRSSAIWFYCLSLVLFPLLSIGQTSANDTIRLGNVQENGINYPMVFMPEFMIAEKGLDNEARRHRMKLRNDISAVYPYAMAAAAIFKDVNENLEKMDARRDRKKYLKTIDRNLDAAFKDPLKRLTIDQGHVLIKLVNRQTGQNCYSIIKELKGGLSAMVWQSVGVFFNNNLVKEYDPEGKDREIEMLVRDLEASNTYNYQLALQQAMLKKAGATAHK